MFLSRQRAAVGWQHSEQAGRYGVSGTLGLDDLAVMFILDEIIREADKGN